MTYRGTNASVAELADALDLGSSGAIRVGSSPSARTNLQAPDFKAVSLDGQNTPTSANPMRVLAL